MWRGGLAAAWMIGSCATAHAQTPVPPGNTGTQTWTLAASPYLLAGDVTVEAGAALTIEPGVIVLAASGDAAAAGASPALVELRVDGSLSAQGTLQAPITFQSASRPSPGAWYGLVLGPTARAVIASTTVAHASVGLTTGVPGRDLALSALTLRACTTGLRIAGGAPVVRDLRVWESGGVVIEGSAAPTFLGALVVGDVSAPSVSLLAPASATFDNATIVGGLDGYRATGRLTVTDSIVVGALDDGFEVDGGTLVLRNSLVWGHGTAFEGIAAPSFLDADPFFVGNGNFRITSLSRARFAGQNGEDLGALPYTGDRTPALRGALRDDLTLVQGEWLVDGDLTIPAGVTLTLAPGVTLFFGGPTRNVRPTLYVEGTLIAAGTSTLPVTFTGDRTVYDRSLPAWGGIRLEASARGSVLEHVVIEQASVGVYHRSTVGQTISEAHVVECGAGMIFETAPALADRVTILSATGVGVRASPESGEMILSRFVVGGGRAGAGVVTRGNVTLDNFTLACGGPCITAERGSLTVTDTIARGCSVGVLAEPAAAATVRNSIIWDNRENFRGPITQLNNILANPLLVGGSDYALTSRSPGRFSAIGGEDLGAVPYAGAATPGLYGTLWSDTTIGPGHSVVAGDLTVASGITLTIEPGATLEFATADVMGGYADVGRAELRVFGTLRAIGTAGAPISFVSSGVTAGSWRGIELYESSTGSILDHASIAGAWCGLHHASIAPQTIRHTTIRDTDNALWISTTAVLDAISVSGSLGTSIYIDAAAAPRITNAVVAGTAGRPSVVTTSSGAPEITSSTVVGGTYCFWAADSAAGMRIASSIIAGCSVAGVARDSGAVEVDTCDLWDAAVDLAGTIRATANIHVDPRFVGPADFHLAPDSGCIDAAAAVWTPPADRDGAPRPLDGDGRSGAAADVGAYEHVRSTTCGDGVVGLAETCDDGPLNGEYSHCNGTCNGPAPRCGDAVIDAPEECDDGNPWNDDACLASCVAARCGDSFVLPGIEQCDDGNALGTDDCVECAPAWCGDGHVRAGVEHCDDGNWVSGDACNTCRIPFCGDGAVRPIVEECDDGNGIQTDDCLSGCVAAGCGDGYIGLGEECDDGNAPDDECTPECRRSSHCGDRILDAGEECDDADSADGDECTNGCRLPRCGDGIPHFGEACDDGNQSDIDGCTRACTIAACGDGVIQQGIEECDDGSTRAGDGCGVTCMFEDDAGAGADGGVTPPPPGSLGGCACRSAPRRGRAVWLLAVAILLSMKRRRS